MAASENVVRQISKVSVAEREALVGHRGAVVWLTGLSGSGKSTVGFALEQRLIASGHLAFALDGDNVRHGLCGDLGFSDADRSENIRRVGEVASLLADAGAIVIACFISPFASDRLKARSATGSDRFFEVHLDTPLDVCESRDPKGLYRKARAGVIKEFTGVSSPYEIPEAPDLRLQTATEALHASVERVMDLLGQRGRLKKP